MTEQEYPTISCPNCQKVAKKTGEREITCEACDAVYVFTKQGAARVKKAGPIEDHESRITALEAKSKPGDGVPSQKNQNNNGEVVDKVVDEVVNEGKKSEPSEFG